jgi:hypothetical protein
MLWNELDPCGPQIQVIPRLRRLAFPAPRQACTGSRSHQLDDIVVTHLEERLLNPDRLADLLVSILDRRRADGDRQQERVATLTRQAADADAKLTRLYAAI